MKTKMKKKTKIKPLLRSRPLLRLRVAAGLKLPDSINDVPESRYRGEKTCQVDRQIKESNRYQSAPEGELVHIRVELKHYQHERDHLGCSRDLPCDARFHLHSAIQHVQH